MHQRVNVSKFSRKYSLSVYFICNELTSTTKIWVKKIQLDSMVLKQFPNLLRLPSFFSESSKISQCASLCEGRSLSAFYGAGFVTTGAEERPFDQFSIFGKAHSNPIVWTSLSVLQSYRRPLLKLGHFLGFFFAWKDQRQKKGQMCKQTDGWTCWHHLRNGFSNPLKCRSISKLMELMQQWSGRNIHGWRKQILKAVCHVFMILSPSFSLALRIVCSIYFTFWASQILNLNKDFQRKGELFKIK